MEASKATAILKEIRAMQADIDEVKQMNLDILGAMSRCTEHGRTIEAQEALHHWERQSKLNKNPPKGLDIA